MLTIRVRKAAAAAILLFILIGYSCRASQEGVEMDNYSIALQKTDPGAVPLLKQGSVTEKEAIARFSALYQVFSEEVIRKDIRAVYAPNDYFRDPFKEVIGADEIEEYFLKSAETIHECRFEIEDVAVHDGDYYFRWIMRRRSYAIVYRSKCIICILVIFCKIAFI